MLNICVINLNDGGELIVEDGGEMNDGCLDIFVSGVGMDEWLVVDSVDEGFVSLDEYFDNYGERCEEDKVEWKEKKKKFKDYVEGEYELNGEKFGKLYLWGVEYDYNMMFVK